MVFQIGWAQLGGSHSGCVRAVQWAGGSAGISWRLRWVELLTWCWLKAESSAQEHLHIVSVGGMGISQHVISVARWNIPNECSKSPQGELQGFSQSRLRSPRMPCIFYWSSKLLRTFLIQGQWNEPLLLIWKTACMYGKERIDRAHFRRASTIPTYDWNK